MIFMHIYNIKKENKGNEAGKKKKKKRKEKKKEYTWWKQKPQMKVNVIMQEGKKRKEKKRKGKERKGKINIRGRSFERHKRGRGGIHTAQCPQH
jgi:hypothetical protein